MEEFDVFIVDIWGVLHDGTRPYEGVLDSIQQLKAAGKQVIALSNSSRRRDSAAVTLRNFGFDPDDFDKIVTSGEAAFHMLSPSSSVLPLWEKLENNDSNRNTVVLGSDGEDAAYLQECGWHVSSADDACFVLCRGPYTVNDGVAVIDKRTDAAAYDQALDNLLESCARRQLPFVVTNPDKVSPSVESAMPGAIGDMYTDQLVKQGVADPESLVKRIGKPFPDVYQLALQGIDAKTSRICMVGDALETDVAGGTRAGIRTVWVVKDGIHRAQVQDLNQAKQLVQAFNANSQQTYAKGLAVHPDFVMEHFRW